MDKTVHKSTLTSTSQEIANLHRNAEKVNITEELSELVKNEEICNFFSVQVKEEPEDMPWTSAMKTRITNTSEIKIEAEKNQSEIMPFLGDHEQETKLIDDIKNKMFDKNQVCLDPGFTLNRYEDFSPKQVEAQVKTETGKAVDEIKGSNKIIFDERRSQHERADPEHEYIEQSRNIKPPGSIPQEKYNEYNKYKCDVCNYQTNWKIGLNRHLVKHKDPQDVEKYKCSKCDFTTIYKSNLKIHNINLHQLPREIDMLKCNHHQCEYKTSRKSHLKEHMMRHGNIEEVDIFKYVEMQDADLKTRILQRKAPKEVHMFECELCDYQSLREDHLKRHFLRHKNMEEVDTYKCNQCSYQTIYKGYIEQHLRIHKDPKTVETFTCEKCDFKTIHRTSLRTHILRHGNPESKFLNCNYCDYQTLTKATLKVHLLRHKNLEEPDTYQCYHCGYRTIVQKKFQKHLLHHKIRTEVNMLRCNECDFKTINIINFKTHLVTHQNPRKVDLFKCNQCSYDTQIKSNLKRHLLRHQDRHYDGLFRCEKCDFKALCKQTLNTHFFKCKKS